MIYRLLLDQALTVRSTPVLSFAVCFSRRMNKYPALPVPLWFFNPFKYNTSCEWGIRMVNEY